MLARAMEVKLQKPVVHAVVFEDAAVADTELDRVSVVDDGLGLLVPGDLERSQLRLDRIADVDRRLLVSDRAHTIGGVEIAPFGRAIRAGIAPAGVVLGASMSCAEWTEREAAQNFQGMATVHGVLPRVE